jgi:hypothetical protein
MSRCRLAPPLDRDVYDRRGQRKLDDRHGLRVVVRPERDAGILRSPRRRGMPARIRMRRSEPKRITGRGRGPCRRRGAGGAAPVRATPFRAPHVLNGTAEAGSCRWRAHGCSHDRPKTLVLQGCLSPGGPTSNHAGSGLFGGRTALRGQRRGQRDVANALGARSLGAVETNPVRSLDGALDQTSSGP